MVDQRLRLSGIGEGLTTRITTILRGADSPKSIGHALQQIFPEVALESSDSEPEFGDAIHADWVFEGLSLKNFLQLIHEQRILDTALDAMAANLDGKTTHFEISRLAAYAGKVSFPIPGESPLGGTISITLEGEGLEDWLHAATWHPGRSQVPRSIDDDLSMGADGEASTWL